ncbi:MAG: sigma-70 family RNA polymerase sigma factor [Zoogloeaceae bacterium]|jgi:RNA polymerase sigma-70 factor (ECF subfamily)|nr:sigma-70 family RNA polymerase sigma factor [Zoogloeaceae bacterium]
MVRTEKWPDKKIRAEDRCFEESWRAVYRALYRRALRLTRGDQGQAEDLLSVTAIKSLEILRRIPERIREPQGFLFLVLRHTYLDSARREMRGKRIFDVEATRLREEEGEETTGEVGARSPLDVLLVTERLEDVSRVFCRLTPQQRQLFELAFLHERAYPEIAENLGISTVLARKRVQLLREKLRRFTKSSQD